MIRRRLGSALDSTVDRVLDAGLLGYTRVGFDLRRRLSGWPALRPDALSGRRVIVTGANGGIGEAVARQAARLGARVDLVVRDPSKGEAAAARIDAEVGRPCTEVWRCDLADFTSIDAFTASYLRSGLRAHALVHNAGALPAERTESADGHELTMAVHVLGPVRMTDRLVGALTPGGRVLLVASGGMYTQAAPADDPEYLDGDYHGATAYARSKRTQVDLLARLGARWPDLWVGAMHPGWVDSPGLRDSLPGFARTVGPLLRTPADGADTISWLLAAQPAPEDGQFWHDRRVRPTHRLPGTRVDTAELDRLWRWVVHAAGLPDRPPSA